jgi:hypothetical protein
MPIILRAENHSDLFYKREQMIVKNKFFFIKIKKIKENFKNHPV